MELLKQQWRLRTHVERASVSPKAARCVALALVAFAACACGEDVPPVDLSVECALLSSTELGPAPEQYMVAMFGDGQTMVLEGRLENTERDGYAITDWTFSTFDETHAPLATGVPLARGRSVGPTRWAARGAALEAMMPADPERPEDPGWPAQTLHWFTLRPDGTFDADGFFPPLSRRSCEACPVYGESGGVLSGGGFATTLVEAGDDLHAVNGAIPRTCSLDDPGLANFFRLHGFARSDQSATPVLWSEETCDPFDYGNSANLITAGTSAAGPFAIFRSKGARDDPERPFRLRLLWLTVDDAGHLAAPEGAAPVVVGREDPLSGPGNLQAPVAVLDGDQILFGDRYARGATCVFLRVMNEDGSDSRRAPWQLPCASGETWSSILELTPLSDELALAVWDEHPGEDRFAEPDASWNLRAAAINAAGQRVSEVLDLGEYRPRGAVIEYAPLVRAAAAGAGEAAITSLGDGQLRLARVQCSAP